MACTIDFRKLDEGFGGKTFKGKRAEQEAEKQHLLDDNDSSMEIDAIVANPSKRQAVASSSDLNKRPSASRPTTE
ncbi:coiled-coil domain-containing protein 86-like [Salvia divinorum]|uniref:Coiled-coil domain-containing protein 86-like n=1 Tax=Salvia divinorum TaxID=28513 RepID=A0ABD1GAD6_SALDI